MVERRIRRIILFAKDVQRMAAFYRDVIGLPIAASPDDSHEFVTLDAGSCSLCLHAIPDPHARDVHITEPPRARSQMPIKLAFHSHDVKRERADLIARGVQMEELREFGDLTYCNGVDVEGNVFQLTNR